MKPLDLQSIRQQGFSMEPSIDAEALVTRFSGTGDLDAIETLGSFLPKVHLEAVAHGVDEVRFDFRDLEFMNSSCFKAFVTFIDNAKSAGPAYRIRFITSAKHYWQRRSLEALRRLAFGLVTIDSDLEH
jgi:hypothetical protein